MTPHTKLVTVIAILVLGATSLQSSAQEPFQFCADPSTDADGDGWGFENGESCIAFLPGLSAPLISLGIERICLEDTDSDGDGWGYEEGRSCVVLETIENDAELASIPRDSTGFPVCQNTDSDPDGDGFGFENLRSCRVGTEVVVTTTGSASETIITDATVVEIVPAVALTDADTLSDVLDTSSPVNSNVDGDSDDTSTLNDSVQEESTLNDDQDLLAGEEETFPSDEEQAEIVIDDTEDLTDTDAIADPDTTGPEIITEDSLNLDDSTSDDDGITNDSDPALIVPDGVVIDSPEDELSPDDALIDLDNALTQDEDVIASLSDIAQNEDDFRLCDANAVASLGQFTFQNTLNITNDGFGGEEVQCMESIDGAVRWRYNYPIDPIDGEFGFPRVTFPLQATEDQNLFLSYQYTAVTDETPSVAIVASFSNNCGTSAVDYEIFLWPEAGPGIAGSLNAVTVGDDRWNAIRVNNATHFIAPSPRSGQRSGGVDIENYTEYLQLEELINSDACLSQVQIGTLLTSGSGSFDIDEFTLAN